MLGTTLAEIREHVEALASEDGEFRVVCARTGARPVPAADERFEDRPTARNAARATEQYRAALRRYDPQVPYHDLIVQQKAGPLTRTTPERRASRRSPTPEASSAAEHGVSPEARAGERTLVEFCHGVAAAVFETLSEHGHEDLETAVMDTYFELAETVTDPDDLCLRLLEGIAAELDRLDPLEQAELLADAADRLGPPKSSEASVSATLAALRDCGLLEEYTRTPWSVDLDGGSRRVVVRLSGYALSPRRGRLPVLPLVLEWYRRRPGWSLARVQVVAVDAGWRITLGVARGTEAHADDLVAAEIRSEV